MTTPACPVPNTHSRLDQVHRLWHQTLSAYDDPDGFCANLNATIEALRNVTFMLQAEKDSIPGFEDWYENWRERMRQDEVLKWLHDARNTVVHKADLDASSHAVGQLHNNITLATVTVEVSPTMPTSDICAAMVNDLPPAMASRRQDLVLSVERRWIANDLPDRELLESLAHAYEFLSDLVRDAHSLTGYRFYGTNDDGEQVQDERSRPACMVTTREVRTVHMSVTDRSLMIPQRVEIRKPTNEVGENLMRRYGISTSGAPKASENTSPQALTEEVVEWSKKMLVKDRKHQRIVFIHSASGWNTEQIMAPDRPGKYTLLRVLADNVRKIAGDAIVDVGEVWIAPYEALMNGAEPEHAHGRREALLVTLLQSDGTYRAYRTPFKRRLFGGIALDKTEVTQGPIPAYLSPLCDVWGLPPPNDGVTW